MKKKIIYGLLFAVAMVTASSSFVSCKDYEGDDYANLRERMLTSEINTQTTIDELIRLQLATVQDQLNSLKQTLGKIGTPAQNAAYADYQNRLQQLMNDFASAKTLDEKMKILGDLNKLISEMDGIGAATGVVMPNAVDVVLSYWGDSLRNAYTTAYSAYSLAQNADALSKENKARLDALKLRADSLFNRANFLADSALQVAKNDIINNYFNKLDSAYKAGDNKLAKDIHDLDSAYKAGDAKLADLINKLDSAYKAGDSILTVRCNDIEAGYKKADSLLQDQIDGLKQDVKDLKQDVDNILGTLKKQISGIIVQGTYSPVFGNGSLPLGIQTNILAAYAGKAVADVQFPSAMKSFDNRNIITEADLAWLESNGMMPASENITAGQLLVNDSEGNAGKMYLTVNPTNVDFSGTDFKLVNSKGYESRIKLSTLEASEDVLTFGWTRGTKVGTESVNGFYEVNATIAKDDALKMQPDFDKAGFKSAVQTALNGQPRLAVKEAARALFNSLQPVERFGVKAEWTDTLGARSVTSAFDIAAFSIEPLGFGFKLPSSKYTRIPTIDKKVIAEKLHIDLNIDPIVITAQDKASGKYIILVEIPEMILDPNKVVIMNDGTARTEMSSGQNMYYEGGDGSLYYGYVYYSGLSDYIATYGEYELRQGYAYLDFTPMFEVLFGQFNTAFANFNTAAAGINTKIDEVVASVNSYIDRANSWINRINSVLDNLGNAVQPVLIWSDGQNAGELGGFVSANYAVGTVVPKDGKLALIPTSYSLELFAPAYKKSLIVTNAYKGGFSAQSGKDASLVDAVKAVNADIKAKGFDVFSGTSLKNPYIFSAKGYEGITFEIAYTAVDYEGKIAGRKFYLTVGE